MSRRLSSRFTAVDSLHVRTIRSIPSLDPDPGFEYYHKARKKGDPVAKAVTVDQGPVAALADASEITGLPRDNLEVHEISKEEFERLRARDRWLSKR
jgi:hypothetical protein